MEQLTRDKSIETFQIVRKLIRFIPKLPQQAAFSLYNYIIGYIMFYVRHPREKGEIFAPEWKEDGVRVTDNSSNLV